MYEIYPDLKVALNKVTIGSIEILRDLGVFNDKENAIDEVREIYLSLENLILFIKAIYKIEDDKLSELKDNYKEIILEEVLRGYWDFFAKFQPPLENRTQFFETLARLTSNTQT